MEKMQKKRFHFGIPSSTELAILARQNNFSLTKEELQVFGPSLVRLAQSVERVEDLSKGIETPRIRPRTGHLPKRSENPFNAWAWKCSIKYPRGLLKNRKLEGKKIAIKDNVLVAGVPLRDGSPLFKDYTPSLDATIVTRILESGGEVAGKSTCEDLCTSGGSHTSHPREVKNPLDPEYMAGGSSSGSAALVAAGVVDMAIGGDQAGSIRIPSSWCGVYGLKPTFGLVPYTGILGMESVLDHVGPIASTVGDLALLLEVISGRDGLDPRQLNAPSSVPSYTRELVRRGRKPRVALVKEGFGWPDISEPKVDRTVSDLVYEWRDTKLVSLREVSIPIHRDAIHVWGCICQDGIWNNVIRAQGLEHLWNGAYDVHLVEKWSKALRDSGNQLSETAKLIGLFGNYAARKLNGRAYALALNLRERLIHDYDLALKDYDILAMPTTPQRAQSFAKKKNLKWAIDAAIGNIQNTCAFDASGHPAINVPLKLDEGLPVGLMLVGRYYDEVTLLRAASNLERGLD